MCGCARVCVHGVFNSLNNDLSIHIADRMSLSRSSTVIAFTIRWRTSKI